MSNLKNGTTVIPGSVYLVDVDGHAAASHVAEKQDIVLVPAPSTDVNDPVNWTTWRKLVSITCLFTYTSAIGIGTAAMYSILQPISDDTGIPLSILNAGTGYMFLLLGWGALITQPVALTFGKRGVYLLSLIGNIAMCMWAPYVKGNGQWLASKIIQGFFCTPVESLCEVSIADVYFAHERGYYIGLYALFLFGSNFVAPIIAGFIYDGQGWHWVMYWCVIINGVALVFCFFFMEETNYVRKGAVAEGNEAEVVVVATGDEEKKHGSDDTSPPASIGTRGTGLIGTPTTFVQALGIFNKKYTSTRTLLTMMYRPILLLRFPVIFWSGFQYGATLVWYNVLNGTASLILSSAPYNFRASYVGLAYFAPLIGITIGTMYSGWFGDKFALRAARRNGGVREPEQRLWLLTASCILVPVSLILWGVGASRNVNWGGLIVGMGMIGCSTGVGSSLSLGYALDSYKDLGGEMMISVIIVRNTLSFAIGYGITPWLAIGYKACFISAAFVGLAITLTFLPVMYFGKRWRASTAERYWDYVSTSIMKGH